MVMKSGIEAKNLSGSDQQDTPEPGIAYHVWRNYPKSGQWFPDPAVSVSNGAIWREIVTKLSKAVPPSTAAFAGLDMGGSPLAGSLAMMTGGGFVELRKIANVRPEMISSLSRNYALGEGIAISPFAVSPGQHVVLVDDTLVSGTTALGAVRLLRKMGAIVTSGLFIFEMDGAGGRERLTSAGLDVHVVQTLPVVSPAPDIRPFR